MAQAAGDQTCSAAAWRAHKSGELAKDVSQAQKAFPRSALSRDSKTLFGTENSATAVAMWAPKELHELILCKPRRGCTYWSDVGTTFLRCVEEGKEKIFLPMYLTCESSEASRRDDRNPQWEQGRNPFSGTPLKELQKL
ncbi:hypothetical protein DV515_00013582 [Chloebia gouldiae]|uniref:Uncharacterized protein n=1 Tax=Chloebia gouldiae TaxID=44316 RepID=A0A3L8S0K9_CHLGU|nr:hypothetical protein DV515_00013582 [Chloebia gouldiae]